MPLLQDHSWSELAEEWIGEPGFHDDHGAVLEAEWLKFASMNYPQGQIEQWTVENTNAQVTATFTPLSEDGNERICLGLVCLTLSDKIFKAHGCHL